MQTRYPTLVDALRGAAEWAPTGRGYTFLSAAGPVQLSFERLWRDACALAGGLQGKGVQHGDRIVLTLATGPAFVRVYTALQLCGAIPCVVPTPGKGPNGASSVRRTLAIGRQLGASAIIASAESGPLLIDAASPVPVWTVAQIEAVAAPAWQSCPARGDDIAVIQATSGSTGTPRCVALTHRNVLSNLEQIGRRLRVNMEQDVHVCWLPLFHDMGLIGGPLFTTYWQLPGVFMDPARFLRDPAHWLRAISDYRGTLSPSPSFAYALATQRTPDSDLAALDLRAWRAALCGAEPIDVAVLQRFTERFAVCGFRPDAFVPCYGLAEATLCVAMHPPGGQVRLERVSRAVMARHGVAESADTLDVEDAATICDCGPPMDGMRLQIVDEAGRPLPEGHVGHILIAGPSVMEAYVGLAEATREVLEDGWLRTGDLGYLRAGRLFVTGRSKDLIIIRGHNYAPSDFEWAAAEVPGVCAGRVVAFGVADPGDGSEQLYLVCEQPTDNAGEEDELRRAIQAHVAKRTGVWATHVGFVPRRTIPRTTSGKVQRNRARAVYLTMRHEAACS